MIRILIFFMSLMVMLNIQLSAKVRLITFHYNEPAFIELQYKAFSKFLEEDHELIVFNDGNTHERARAIRKMCEKYGIKCVRFEQKWHAKDPLNLQIKQWLDDPNIYSHISFNRYPEGVSIETIAQQASIRHCHAIQYAMDHFGYDHNDIVAIVDGDCFPIRPVSLKLLLKDCDIFGINRYIAEENVEYLWVPFIAFDPRRLPNLRDLKFNVSVINNKMHDTGAETYHYLKNNPHVRAKKYLGSASTGYYNWSLLQLKTAGFSEEESWLIKNLPWPQCVEFHIDKRFLHFGGSSFELEGHKTKAEYVAEFINAITAR